MRTLSLLIVLVLVANTRADEAATGKLQTTRAAAKIPSVVKRALHEHPTLLKMLDRNNVLRRSAGLPPHRISPALTKAAQNHAWFMARTGAFSHESNGGPMARAQRYGYRSLVRENIAMGQMNVSHAFSSWRSSGGHWANITSHTRDAGFGFAIAPNGDRYWVAVYGDGDNR